MKAIADSIIYLQKKVNEIKDNPNLEELRIALNNQKRGMIYALQMMGLDFEFTDIEGTKGKIVQYSLGARGPLGPLGQD